MLDDVRVHIFLGKCAGLLNIYKKKNYKVVELVGGGSVINGATQSSFSDMTLWASYCNK